MNEYETLEFKSSSLFREWLDQNHSAANGVWLKLYKKASGIASVAHAEALDVALCYGWIDGQRKRLDDTAFLQKFTPRRPRSLWSKRNIEHIERLTAAGLMMPAGLREVQKAKDDGRWEAAYDAASTMTIPEDFLTELEKYPEAKAFFETLNKTNKFAIGWRLQTAKTEVTRIRRRDTLIAMLRSGEKI